MNRVPSSNPSSIVLRSILRTLALLVLLPASSFAATFYVSPSGNDNNPGTQSSPFRSITRAQAAASSGDTVLLRGGTYSGFTIAGSDSNYNFVHHITKSNITYAAFPGETPVFNFAGTTTAKRVAAFRIAPGVTNVTFRGFHVTGVPVGTQKQSECFRIQGNAHFDRMTCRDSQANGFYFTSAGSGSCTNCDAYNLIGVGESVGNTDGFGAHAGPVTFTGCRAWNCSDDGFDCISTDGQVIFDRCWAYNMRFGGDSTGFKVGGYGRTGAVANPMPSHIVRYCLSANNGAHGFYANHQPGKAADWTNNTAYNNSRSNFNMLEQVSPTDRTDIPGTREVFHYNIAYVGTTIINDNHPPQNKTNNSWTKPGVTVNAADFQSLDATQMTNPRQPDGSLPEITFMRLVPGSDLVGMGNFADSGTGPGPGTTIQAESAAIAGGVTIDSNYSGFNGTGFVNFPSSGGTLTFNNVSGNGGGSKSITFRYALGATSSRTGTLTVNGSTSNITFSPTGSWSTWTTMAVTVNLNNNTSNTIRLQSTGQDLANVDELFVPSGVSAGIIANGTYRVVARHSGKALDAAGTADGSNVQQYAYWGGANQQWVVTHLGNNQYSVVGVQSGRALDAAGTSNGSNVQQYAYWGGNNQKWTVSATSGGYYRLTPTHATNMALDVNAVSTADGANIQLWTYGGGNNQQWAFQAP